MTRVERNREGMVRVITGGVRAEIRGDVIAFATEGLVDRISASCRSEPGSAFWHAPLTLPNQESEHVRLWMLARTAPRPRRGEHYEPSLDADRGPAS